MRKTGLASLSIFLILFGGACAQTKCIWLEKSENGEVVQKYGVSVQLVRLLARPGASIDINGSKIPYDSLQAVYNEGSDIHVKDKTGETRIYAGEFGERMKEETERHNHLIVESTDSDGTIKVEKIRVESVEAVTLLLAMISSKDLDEDTDKIESALDRGGVLYIRSFKNDSRLWIYVN
ncbi:MAG: hypothetical protein WAO19_06610 [Candidatus Kryptoniota bacterium]